MPPKTQGSFEETEASKTIRSTNRRGLEMFFLATESVDDEVSMAASRRPGIVETTNTLRNNMTFHPSSLSYGVGYALGPVAAASVLIWIGVWDLQDHFLFPDNDLYSGLACVGIAIPLTVMVHVMSRRKDHDNHGIPYVITISLCGIEYWRGVWLLWESCVLPSNPPIQSLMAIFLGAGILMITDNFTARVAGPSVMFPHWEEEWDTTMTDTQHHGDYTDDLEAGIDIPSLPPKTLSEDTGRSRVSPK